MTWVTLNPPESDEHRCFSTKGMRRRYAREWQNRMRRAGEGSVWRCDVCGCEWYKFMGRWMGELRGGSK